VEKYLPNVRKTARRLAVNWADPDQVESLALDYTIETVRLSTGPARLRRDLVKFVGQRLRERLCLLRDDRTQQLDDILTDRLSCTDPQSAEEIVASTRYLLDAPEQTLLLKVLYQRRDEPFFKRENGEDVSWSGSLTKEEYRKWRVVLTKLQEWAKLKGLMDG
jgi:hypothetical protein